MKKTLFLLLLFTNLTFSQSKTIDSLKTVLSKTSDLKERYNLLNQMRGSYYASSVGENTAENNLQALRIALKLKDDKMIAESYNLVGDYYLFEKGDFNTGLIFLFKAIPHAQKLKNERSLSSVYVDISTAYSSSLSNFPESLNYVKKAEAALPDKSNKEHDFLLLQVSCQFTQLYLALHQPTKALPYLNKATELISKQNPINWDIQIKSYFGEYYYQLGDKELALIYFNKAKELEDKVKSLGAKSTFKLLYINYLLIEKEYDKAALQAKDMFLISEEEKTILIT